MFNIFCARRKNRGGIKVIPGVIYESCKIAR